MLLLFYFTSFLSCLPFGYSLANKNLLHPPGILLVGTGSEGMVVKAEAHASAPEGIGCLGYWPIADNFDRTMGGVDPSWLKWWRARCPWIALGATINRKRGMKGSKFWWRVIQQQYCC